MLYDPRWEVEIKADPLSLEGLIAWLERKPADQEYDFLDNANCLNAQYFKARGFPLFSCGTISFAYWRKKHFLWLFPYKTMTEVAFPMAFNVVAVKEPRTFGAALERARAYR